MGSETPTATTEIAPPQLPLLIRRAAAASLLGLSIRQFDQWCADGKVPARCRAGKQFVRSKLVEWIEAGMPAPEKGRKK